MKDDFTVKGQERLAEIGRNMATAKVGDTLAELIKEVAFITERGIKVGITKLDAVDTGFMRASVRLNQIGKRQAKVGPNADYSIYVHEGTRFMKGRPFIDVGVDLVKGDIDRAMKRSGEKISLKIVK